MDERLILWGLILGMSLPSLYAMGACDRLPVIGTCARLQRACGADLEALPSSQDATCANVGKAFAQAWTKRAESPALMCELHLNAIARAPQAGVDKAVAEMVTVLEALGVRVQSAESP
ncbi:MAG TPA: hypothetical protein VFH51_08530 [Myxococcota bacterium]|nr:hypothetical protein [Myxococcota bacterium]